MLATYICFLRGVRNTLSKHSASEFLNPDVARGGLPVVGLLERDLIKGKGTAPATFKHVL